MNFETKYIERFEAECELHKTQIKQNKEQMEDYESEIEELKRKIQMEEMLKKEKAIESAATIEEKDAMIQAQNEELKKYREQELKKEHRRRDCFKFCVNTKN